MNTATLIDCHLHLQDESFAPDLPAVTRRANTAGVRLFVCNGSSQSDWPTVMTMATSDRTIIPCFGIHPWYAPACAPHWLAELKHFLEAVPSAVGETGLDRFVEPRNEPAQLKVFRAQLSLAAELDRPITIHCVRAWGWMMDILSTHRPLPKRMLFHSYGGSAELIKPLSELGCYFSYSGNLLREKAVQRRQALAATPLDRLLLETDSPDIIPPRSYCIASGPLADGKPRNEPANLAGIVRGASSLLNVPFDELADRLLLNARSLFGKLVPLSL